MQIKTSEYSSIINRNKDTVLLPHIMAKDTSNYLHALYVKSLIIFNETFNDLNQTNFTSPYLKEQNLSIKKNTVLENFNIFSLYKK